jgi:hypothetical protein
VANSSKGASSMTLVHMVFRLRPASSSFTLRKKKKVCRVEN